MHWLFTVLAVLALIGGIWQYAHSRSRAPFRGGISDIDMNQYQRSWGNSGPHLPSLSSERAPSYDWIPWAAVAVILGVIALIFWLRP
jgi:hypothetical protein